MPDSRLCPQCGVEMPRDAPDGVCPKCVLGLGIASQVSGNSFIEPHPSSAKPDDIRGAETVVPLNERSEDERSIDHNASPAESGYRGPFTAPTTAELAKHFPQLEIIELLGQGGMGAVYKAREPELDRLVALKILPPEAARDPAFAERFKREARALAKLNHPNIVAVYGLGEADGLYYFIMEYVDGVNLRELIRNGQCKPEQALRIVPQICEALQFAHDEGIVHRDIKPENILLDKRGRLKIADFGLARLLSRGDGGSPALPRNYTLTGPWQVMGTPNYMAPEQMDDPLTVDHRADIYALGVVFYEMLTGELPRGRFAPPSQKVQVDVRLDEVVLRALEQEPQRRYQRASEVKTDVESIVRAPPAPEGFAAAMSPASGDPRAKPRTASPTPIPHAPAKVSDAHMLRRLTVFISVAIAVWTSVLGGLQLGYVSGADWYFKKELPYDDLTTLFFGVSLLLGIWLTQWWYLLAKQPDAPRSLADFWRLAQTPDPRMKRIWKPALAILVIYLIAGVGSSQFGDAVESSVLVGGFGLVPIAFMAILRWAYAERFCTNTGARAVAGVLFILGPVALLVGLATLFHFRARAKPETAEVTYRVAGPQVEVSLNGKKADVSADGLATLRLRPGDYETTILKGNSLQKRVYEFIYAGEFKQADETDADAIWIKGPLTLEFEPSTGRPTVADFTAIQGMWNVVAQMKGDGFLSDQQRGKWIEFEKSVMRSDLPATPLYQPFLTEARFAIDSSTSPKQFDIVEIGAKGIYRLDGDTLTLAIADAAQPRPGEFVSRSGPGAVTLTLCRRASAATIKDGEKVTQSATPAEQSAANHEATKSASELHRAAQQGDAARIKQLFDAGASINSKDAGGQTPLMKAVAGGHRSLAITLIMLGADITEQDKRGQSVLMIAAENRDAAFLSKLSDLSQITYEQDTTKRKEKLQAIPGVDRTLLANREVDLRGIGLYEAELLKDEAGENALMKAARAGDWECFQLMAHQMDALLAHDKVGRTVLMHAVLGGHAKDSRWLEQFEWLTKSPYLGVAGVDNVFVGGMLIFDLERSLAEIDNSGKTVLQYADELDQPKIADILRRHLQAIVTNQTDAIERGGDNVRKHYRLRSIAWRALGEKEQAEADFKKSSP